MIFLLNRSTNNGLLLSIIQNPFSWYLSFEEIVYMWKKANTFLTVSWYLQIFKSTDSSFFKAIFSWELVVSLRFTLLRCKYQNMLSYLSLKTWLETWKYFEKVISQPSCWEQKKWSGDMQTCSGDRSRFFDILLIC